MSILHTLIYKLIPKQYSIVEENNIIGKYDESTLITRDENFVKAIEVEGISYISMTDDNIASALRDRKNAFRSISDDVNVKILIKRREKIFNKKYDIDNNYASKLINSWEGNEKIYENQYIIFIETRNKNALGYLENAKTSLTTSINETNKENSDDKTNKTNKINITYINKINILNNIINYIKQSLAKYNVSELSANVALSLYAEYCNGYYVPLKCHNGLLGDSYIGSNVYMKKDYIIQEFQSKKKFIRFISIKAYDTEEVSSLFLNSLLYLDKEINIFFYIEKMSKQNAIKKINDKIRLSPNIVKGILQELKELVITGRESMQYLTFFVQVMGNTKEELDNNSKDISIIFNNLGLINVYETINQMAIFFSFFPNKEFLNNRKRIQTTEAISTMLMLERDISGESDNSWGQYPLTMFKNQNQSPFLFNLHTENRQNALGHSVIIGGTGAGKTTLLSWLIVNCFKYDINILALDKANGLYALTNYLNGEYLDGNSDKEPFCLNPFSLEYSKENENFLVDWLCNYLLINREEAGDSKKVTAIEAVIDKTFRVLKAQGVQFNIKAITQSLEKLEDENIQLKLNSIVNDTMFSSLEDSISLTNKLSVINMDFIENKEHEAGLIAYYLLHKMLYLAKNKSKGFFAFIDEFRTYAHNKLINDRINYMITQARKLNGVVAIALQDLEQLNEVQNADSIIGNMGNYIIFPTTNIKQFEKYNIELSDYEKHFLIESPENCRKVLIKNKITKTSNIVNIDLSKLGGNLAFLSSNSEDVNKIKELKTQNAQEWRELYLRFKER